MQFFVREGGKVREYSEMVNGMVQRFTQLTRISA